MTLYHLMPGMTEDEQRAYEAYVKELVAAAPHPTPELIAELQPIFAAQDE